MDGRARVAGVGMVPFTTPGRGRSYEVMGELAARAALADAGIGYEQVQQTPAGTAEKFVHDEDNTCGGRVVVNPSGGLLSRGHPIGATGLAQAAELVWQLRGRAEGRQAEGARLALQHNVGLGGAAVVTLYERVC